MVWSGGSVSAAFPVSIALESSAALLLSSGAPHQNLAKGMKDEHCAKAGCTDSFVTSNYGVRTNPCKEFEIATGQRECLAEDMLDKRGREIRVLKHIEELKQLKVAEKAGLTADEILAVVPAKTTPLLQYYTPQ